MVTNNVSHRVYVIPFATVYPLYVTKIENKGRTVEELDRVICWLTGYTQDELKKQIAAQVSLESFFAAAPHLNPSRNLIKGVICGVRIEEIEEDTMREIRYMDKLVDELAKGRVIEKILRTT